MKSPIVTPRQLEILTLLFRYRFLDRHHIQKFLGHKKPQRTNVWLKDLTKKKLVGRIYSKKIGENTKPAIYYLDTKAKKILKESKDDEDINKSLLNRIYREKKRSKRFIDHSLFLADMHHHLQTLATKNGAKLFFFTKMDLAGIDYLPEPLPDSYIAIKGKDSVGRYFFEYFQKGIPRYALRHRIVRYFDYYESDAWETATEHPFPEILLVGEEKETRKYLERFIRQTSDELFEDRIQFLLTTKKKIKNSGAGKKIWETVEYE